MNPQLLRILPEVILTVTGVLIMLIDPVLPKSTSRRSMGWLAVVGTVIALFASTSSCTPRPAPRTTTRFRPMPFRRSFTS